MRYLGKVDLGRPLKTDSYVCSLFETKYQTGHVAIVLISSDSEPFMTLTVNLENPSILAENEIAIKNWGGNEKYLDEIFSQTDLFEETNKTTQCGYAEAKIWRFKS